MRQHIGFGIVWIVISSILTFPLNFSGISSQMLNEWMFILLLCVALTTIISCCKSWVVALSTTKAEFIHQVRVFHKDMMMPRVPKESGRAINLYLVQFLTIFVFSLILVLFCYEWTAVAHHIAMTIAMFNFWMTNNELIARYGRTVRASILAQSAR